MGGDRIGVSVRGAMGGDRIGDRCGLATAESTGPGQVRRRERDGTGGGVSVVVVGGVVEDAGQGSVRVAAGYAV
jgi:hypothetical protein